MRGIEGALRVLDEVEKGAFAAESLRRVWGDVIATERKLTATLVYITLRRLGLWKHLLGKYCKRSVDSLDPRTLAVLLPGIAGVIELRHFKPGVLVNALVQQVKDIRDENGVPREAALVNAVLHTVIEQAPRYIETLVKSTALRDLALANGVPGWVAAEWNRDWGVKEAKTLLKLTTAQTYLSLRAAPALDRMAWCADYVESRAMPSEAFDASIRLEANPYPPELPGYRDGLVTPQSESSMWVVESLLAYWRGGALLDMCAGRGIKAGHLLSYWPDAVVEGWDLSAPKLKSAERDLERLGVRGRAVLRCGDALSLTPGQTPSAILLDAPCSGSGTWGRHPEGKWRMSPTKVKRNAELQFSLFKRAADIVPSGGIIVYCTCSLFREENEKVVGAVLSARDDLTELPIRGRTRNISYMRKGKPYGTTLLPESPWMDGFYAVIFRKK